MDEATKQLLRELRGSPTDLAKLVERVQRRPDRLVAIPGPAVARWRKDDPDAWERVRAWLMDQGLCVVVID